MINGAVDHRRPQANTVVMALMRMHVINTGPLMYICQLKKKIVAVNLTEKMTLRIIWTKKGLV